MGMCRKKYKKFSFIFYKVIAFEIRGKKIGPMKHPFVTPFSS